MAKEIGENTKITINLKTIGLVIGGLIVMVGMWFTLQADIQEAKELPKPSIERIEYDLKDELIRQTIIETQKDIESILEKLEKLDERLYEISLKQI